MIPEWTQPSLSQEELRKTGGVPPPPQPVLPNQFIVQLYNPDQQITVYHRPSTWHSAQAWDFEMPIQTFRQPSISNLDRTQSDPTVSEATPTVGFRWKREGKISKDLICNLSGKSTKPDGSKRKQKEPDIPMAFFRNLQEMSVFEPNLTRVDMEDPKGFEVVLLLSAAVIKDIYYSSIRDSFNIGETSRTRTHSNPIPGRSATPSHNNALASQVPQSLSPANAPSSLGRHQRPSLSLETPSAKNPTSSRPPPTDPRSQWEIDAETARLRQQVDEEERQRKQKENEELRNVRKMVEEEQRQARRRDAEINKETDRLRREYEAEQKRLAKASGRNPNLPPRHSAPPSAQQQQYLAPYGGNTSGPYLQAPESASSASFAPADQQRIKPKRSHFFGLRGGGEPESNRLLKKSSAIF